MWPDRGAANYGAGTAGSRGGQRKEIKKKGKRGDEDDMIEGAEKKKKRVKGYAGHFTTQCGYFSLVSKRLGESHFKTPNVGIFTNWE